MTVAQPGVLEQVLGRPVGQAGIGDVDQRQQEPGEDLEPERDRQDAAEQVPDAVRLDRDQVVADHLPEPELVAQRRPKRRSSMACASKQES